TKDPKAWAQTAGIRRVVPSNPRRRRRIPSISSCCRNNFGRESDHSTYVVARSGKKSPRAHVILWECSEVSMATGGRHRLKLQLKTTSRPVYVRGCSRRKRDPNPSDTLGAGRQRPTAAGGAACVLHEREFQRKGIESVLEFPFNESVLECLAGKNECKNKFELPACPPLAWSDHPSFDNHETIDPPLKRGCHPRGRLRLGERDSAIMIQPTSIKPADRDAVHGAGGTPKDDPPAAEGPVLDVGLGCTPERRVGVPPVQPATAARAASASPPGTTGTGPGATAAIPAPSAAASVGAIASLSAPGTRPRKESGGFPMENWASFGTD
ncbi:hypothetical protein THAOC_07242, partial [Thalassiosira oceanica]